MGWIEPLIKIANYKPDYLKSQKNLFSKIVYGITNTKIYFLIIQK